MDFTSEDGLVNLRIEDGQLTWIGISPRFREAEQPIMVLATVAAMVNEHAPRLEPEEPKRFTFRPGYDYETMDQINEELARLSSQIQSTELEEFPNSSRTVTAVGRGGRLVTFLMTEEYFDRTTAQDLSEGLTESITAMLEAQTDKEGVAQP